MSLPPAVVADARGVVVTIRLTPRGGRDALDGVESDPAALAARVARILEDA